VKHTNKHRTTAVLAVAHSKTPCDIRLGLYLVIRWIPRHKQAENQAGSI